MSEVLLSVQGLGKSFARLSTAGERLGSVWAGLAGRPPAHRVDILRDIGFEVRRGQSLAILGENGAGKSTLLKLVCGVLTPSQGSVRIHGRIGALLELGAGFHPELSGRENVRLAAALHGLHGQALAGVLPAIETFADIGGYFDEPVKHYSSGMVVRLGFAVMAQLRPDLLVTDEVLAVGDEGFQRKCIRWLDDYLASGGTLLLVSHSLYHVRRLCGRALWLRQGRIEAIGEAHEVAARYQAWHEARLASEAPQAVAPAAGADYRIESVRINGAEDPSPVVVAMGSPLEQEVVLRSHDGRPPVFLNGWVRADGTPVYGVSSEMDGVAPQPLGDSRFRFRLRFDALPLLPGRYRLRSHALDPEALRLFDTLDREVEVQGDAREYGLVRLPHAWPGEGE